MNDTPWMTVCGDSDNACDGAIGIHGHLGMHSPTSATLGGYPSRHPS